MVMIHHHVGGREKWALWEKYIMELLNKSIYVSIIYIYCNYEPMKKRGRENIRYGECWGHFKFMRVSEHGAE